MLDIIYPPKCPACRREVAEHGMWCGECLRQILAVRELDFAGHGLKALDSCLAVCAYKGGLKRIIHDIKFRHADKYGRHLCWLLTAGVISEKLPRVAVIVPVPLDKQKLAERGFNQTELIFKPWALTQQLAWRDCLERLRPTQPQWELGLNARKANIRGAFSVMPEGRETIVDQDILLVDDIFTTGITLDECSRALKKAGANRVYGLVLASGAK